jgi:hypothetical protein
MKIVNKDIHPMDVSFDWRKTAAEELDLSECIYLTIRHHLSKRHDFHNLPYVSQLKSLSIYFSNINSLKGIEKFLTLENLELYYMSKLMNIEGISKLHKLNSLNLFNAKKVKDFSEIGSLKQLRALRICDSGDINDLRFLKGLNQLRELSFAGSNVVCGDLSIIEELPMLEWCGFDNKKHYSHSYEQINSILLAKK